MINCKCLHFIKNFIKRTEKKNRFQMQNIMFIRNFPYFCLVNSFCIIFTVQVIFLLMKELYMKANTK